MASFNGNFNGQYAYSVLYLDYSFSQSIDTNETTFNYNLRIQKNASTTQSYQSNCPFSLIIGGKNLGGTFNLDLRNVGVNGSQSIKSGSIPFKHDESGKLGNIVCSASVDSSVGLGDAALSGSVPIPDIPRASKFGEIENFNVEGTIVILLTKYVSSWTDNLTIKLDDVVIKTIDNVSNNQEIVFTEEELETIYTLMTNDNKKTFTFENVTLNGETQIGSIQIATAEGTITDANPILSSFDYKDTNQITLALTNDANKIINGKSTLNITNLVANAVKGASLKIVQINGTQYPYTEDFSVEIENYKGNTITLYVIDSRNNSSKLENLIGINYVEYSEPKIISKNAERKNFIEDISTLIVNGSYSNIDFGVSKNSLSATYKYKETGTSNWMNGLTALAIVLDNNIFDIEQAIKGDTNSGFNASKSYDIKIIISDLLSDKEETFTLIAGKPAMDIYKNKIAFGGIADEDSEYQTQFKDKANFKKGLYINGNSIYPIGSIYISTDETSPAELFGGIWERIKDTFLLAAGDTYEAGETGGSSTHTLTVDEMPSHNHILRAGDGGNGQVVGVYNTPASGYTSYYLKYNLTNATSPVMNISNTGGGKEHNNMPPYLAVYIWKKVGESDEEETTNSYTVDDNWMDYNSGNPDGTLTFNDLNVWMYNYDSTPDVLDGISLDFEIEGAYNLIGNFNFNSYEGAPRNFGIYIYKDGELYKELPQQFDALGSAFDVSIDEEVETGSYQIVVGAYNNFEFGIGKGDISFIEM